MLSDSDDRVMLGIMAALALAIVIVFAVIIAMAMRPLPTCPDGFVLAGGGYAGEFHCIPGRAPIK